MPKETGVGNEAGEAHHVVVIPERSGVLLGGRYRRDCGGNPQVAIVWREIWHREVGRGSDVGRRGAPVKE
jgi:hypothetical protein